MAKRSTKEAYEIVKYTYELIANDKNYTEIRGALHEKYKIAYRSADRYYTLALKIIRKEYAKEICDIRNISLLNYERMIENLEKEEMSSRDKYRIKLDIKKQMDKIKGIEVIRHELSGNINTNIELKIIGIDNDNSNTQENSTNNTENKT
jgi:hypothetical protein